MSVSSKTAEIEALFLPSFHIANPDVDVAVDNDNYKPVPGKTWVRFSIKIANSDQFALGSVNERVVGVVFVQVFTAVGEGTMESRRVTELAMSIFRGSSSSSIRYGIPFASAGMKESGWYMATVKAPFSYEIFH